MADNISELPQPSQEGTQQPSGGKWGFLRKAVRISKERLGRIVPSVRHEQKVDVAKPVVEQVKVQIPEDSGLEQLIKRLEEVGEGTSANRIKLLYPDFIKYLNGNLKDRYNNNPDVLARISNELNSGNKEIIEMFARVLAERFSQEAGQIRPTKNAAGRQPLQAALESPGYKKREGELLAYEMKKRIETEEGRSSRADFTSQNNEWKMLLSKPQAVSVDVNLDKELAGIVLDPTLPSSPSLPPQK